MRGNGGPFLFKNKERNARFERCPMFHSQWFRFDPSFQLLSLIKTYEIPLVEVSPECIELTERYMERKIFPARYRDDGLHIAIATVNYMDVVVSWNLRHMVKLKTRREVKAVNIVEGYREIEICTPMEVIESD